MTELPPESEPSGPTETVDPAAVPNAAARVSIQRHIGRPALGAWRVNRAVVVIIGLLLIVGSLALISQRVNWSHEVLTWWPSVLIGLAALGLLVALIRRSSGGWLASVALLGGAIGLLLTTAYGLNFGSVWLGVALISIGAGTLLRGLLWGTRV